MSALERIFITVPKSFSKTHSFPTQRVRFATSLISENINKNRRMSSTTEDDATLDASSLIDQNVCFRGKKRRLDHLTWEEKIQRKKLKNRVAAQTSRDRKRAKLDELEETVRLLREKNDALIQECSVLKSQNETLTVQNTLLRKDLESRTTEIPVCSECQSRVGSVAPMPGSTVSSIPSAAGWVNQTGTSSDPEPTSRNTVEDLDPLPPLEELFADLQGDDYIERLEELAESLLREVTAEVEANAHQSSEQINIPREATKESSDTTRMVGQTSENVETDRTNRSLNTRSLPDQSSGSSTTPIFCTPTNADVLPTHENVVEVKEEPNLNDMDTVYGTYDESTNCITIIYPGNGEDIKIEESVQEISSDSIYNEEDSTYLTPGHAFADHLSPAHTFTDSLSPASNHSEDIEMVDPPSKIDSHLSDGGYESHGSPNTEIINTNAAAATLTDLWHESFSELFPSLA
ncbi:LOW QUALITY PROTEIN: uncharacterized protein LOC105690536 [Athalia rosae]|uniref:LOW QUALITY PROTEIN: uncharacterized protein LOC105690536 n=1 Tax=Athalia rosae TaxID=37344 RepID=UPI00203391FA|nr:LOW QUALITY PROTEIN: uncharacterized protein LOC105690536 [Athalia rosae]